MKANAKKLLALILAMVMCLSLAAPALAAGSDALAVQASSALIGLTPVASNTDTATVTDLGEGKGDYEVTDLAGKALATGNVKNTTQPSGVKVTLAKDGVDVIGKTKTASIYTVEYDKDGLKGANYVEYGKDSATRKSVLDVADSEWKTLEGAQSTYADANDNTKAHQVKGSVYQEPQGTKGTVIVYFKLTPVENGEFKDDKSPVYLVNKTEQKPITTTEEMREALKGAKKCDFYGEVGGTPVAIENAGVSTDVKTVNALPSVYRFTTVNPINLVSSVTNGVKNTGATAALFNGTDDTINVTFEGDATTGSFQVSIKDETKTASEKKDIFVTTPADAQKILEKDLEGAEIVSVEAATGNFLTVNVKKPATADAYATATDLGAKLYGKNVWFFTDENGKKEAVLIDQTKEGFYNATTEGGANAKSIPADTEALGPVVVRKNDIPTGWTISGYKRTIGSGSDYYVFSSSKKIKITAANCKEAKSIPYVQLVMNPWKGDKKNSLVVTPNAGNYGKTFEVQETKSWINDVTVQNGANEVTLANNWYENAYTTPNADFVKKGTVDVEAGAHGALIEVVESTKASCKKKGTKTVKSVCSICNKVVSEKTEELPIVTDPVEKNTKKVKDVNGDEVEKMYFEDTEAHSTNHYLNKVVTTTGLSEDGSQSVVTEEFYCNLGELHETRKTVVKKVNLQHSGNWNLFQPAYRNDNTYTMELGINVYDDITNLFGYSPILIVDSDVENENLALNRKSVDIPATDQDNKDTVTGDDVMFKFTGFGANAVPNADGSYSQMQTKVVKNVYASAKALPETKTYVAKLTAKDIKKADHECLTGSAVLEAEVYEVNTKKALGTNAQDAIGAANLAKNLEKGYVVLKSKFTKNVTLRAYRPHAYDEKTGVCALCNQSREAVESAKFTADTVTAEDLTYTGKVVQPKVTVYDTQGNKLLNGIDYVVETIQDYKVGEYTITVKGIDDYAGNRVTVPFKIVAAPVVTKKQTLKVSVAKKTYKVKNLKKKKASFTTKLSGAKTAVTWKSSNKNVTVKVSGNKATITVKKGTKKGTYKVTATAKKATVKNVQYKKATATIKVVVK